MQKILNDNNGYETIIEVSDVLKPEGHKIVSFYSRWNKANNPDEKILRYSIVLNESEFFSLQQSLVSI